MTRTVPSSAPPAAPGAQPNDPVPVPMGSTSKSKWTRTIVHAAHGHAFYIAKSQKFRLVDLHGQQVIDLMAWAAPYSPTTEHSSMSYTRHAIGGSAPPTVGEAIYSNHDRPMLTLLHDDVKTHDMLFMACNPGFYARLGEKGHRNCAENIAEAMRDLGSESERFRWTDVVDPFNVFQNTPYYSLKGRLGSSRPGDCVVWRAEMDLVVAVSSCPFTGDGFNGGKVTEVAVEVQVV